MPNIVVGRAYRVAICNAILSLPHPWNWSNADEDGVIIHLFKNQPALTPGMALADFQEPTFTGYSAPNMAATQGLLHLDGVTQDLVMGSDSMFYDSVTAIINPGEIVYGYYVATSDTNQLLWAAYLPAPVPVSAVLEAVNFIPSFALRADGLG